MGFRIAIVLSLIVLAYAAFEWGRLAWLAKQAYEPGAEFLADGPPDSDLYAVLYLDYRCANCANAYAAFDGLRAARPDIRYVVRPLSFIDEESLRLMHLVLAAGLKGKFDEMHRAFLERNGNITDSFLRETAALYDLDYEEWIKDSESDEVHEIIDDIFRAAETTGVESVPSFTIGRTWYRAPDPIETVDTAMLLSWLAREEQKR